MAALALLAAAPVNAGTPKSYEEVAGTVSMEAENAQTIVNWDEVPGISGTAMMDNAARNQGWMRYSVTFKQTGKFYVYLLCKYTGTDPASANDAYVELDGERLYGSDDVTRPEGMRVNRKSMTWSYLPKGPGGLTPDNIKTDPVYFKVTSTGTKTLEIRSRSKGFVVDKIVMVLDGGEAGKPSGTGPAETVATPISPDAGQMADAGPTVDVAVEPLQIIQPAASTTLMEGTVVTLQGSGPSGLTWSYDGHSDGLPEITIGSGATVLFSVPLGLSGARTLTLYLAADTTKIEQTHPVVAAPGSDGGTADAGVVPRGADAGMADVGVAIRDGAILDASPAIVADQSAGERADASKDAGGSTSRDRLGGGCSMAVQLRECGPWVLVLLAVTVARGRRRFRVARR